MSLGSILNTPIKVGLAALTSLGIGAGGGGAASIGINAKFTNKLPTIPKIGGKTVWEKEFNIFLSWGGLSGLEGVKLKKGESNWLFLFAKGDICEGYKGKAILQTQKLTVNNMKLSDNIKCFTIQ